MPSQSVTENLHSIYEPLDPSKGEIRRFALYSSKQRTADIECSIETYSLNTVSNDDRAYYTAMSYCWGDKRDIAFIHLTTDFDESRWRLFPVTRNLHNFLRQARRKRQSIWLWADQICINQADNMEKAYQIRLMGTIFRKAYHVYCWLGEARQDTYLAVQMLRDIEDGPVNYHLIQENHLRAMLDILYRPWWFRLWVAQEVILAQSLVLMCGRHEFSLWQVGMASQNFNSDNPTSSETVLRLAIDKRRFDPWLAEQIAGRLHACVSAFLKPNFSDPDGLPKIMDSLRGLRCSDRRDKVYGVLGIYPDSAQCIRVNYGAPLRQVYITTSFSLMKQSMSLDILVLASIPRVQLQNPEIPSWVCDWRAPEEGPKSKGWRMALAGNMFCLGGLWLHESRLFNACGSFAFNAALVDEDVLRTGAIGLGRITSLGAYGCTFDTQPAFGGWTERFQEWFKSLELDQNPLYPPDVDHSKAFLSTISRDIAEVAGALVRMFDEVHTEFAVRTLIEAGASLSSDIDGETQRLRNARSNRFYSSMVNVRLCRLSDGYLAQVPDISTLGDRIYILGGTRLPFVLRQIGDEEENAKHDSNEQRKTFRLVGPCFVFGAMDGQAVLETSIKENIHLV